MAASLYDLSVTDASNTAFNGISQAENVMLPSNVNNMFRAKDGAVARFIADEWAVNTATGTDTYALTAAQGITAYATGIGLRFICPNTNTGAATLNVNTVGAKAIRKISGGTDVALVAGDLAAGETYTVIYRASANGAAGGWVLVGLSSSVSLNTLWAKGADVASSGTTALGSGNFFHITGTTTITDIDFSSALDGRMAWVEFDGALTLTHNGTTLTLPGGANITTAAGDRACLVQDSGDNIHVLFYQPYIAPPPYITPWVAYTPTFTGWGTVSGVSMFSRRVGDTLEVQGYVTCGTATATEARMSLGFNGTDGNVTTHATKLGSGTTLAGFVAKAIALAANFTVLAEPSVGYCTFGSQDGSNAGLTKLNGNVVLANATKHSIKASFPIAGW